MGHSQQKNLENLVVDWSRFSVSISFNQKSSNQLVKYLQEESHFFCWRLFIFLISLRMLSRRLRRMYAAGIDTNSIFIGRIFISQRNWLWRMLNIFMVWILHTICSMSYYRWWFWWRKRRLFLSRRAIFLNCSSFHRTFDQLVVFLYFRIECKYSSGTSLVSYSSTSGFGRLSK